MSFRSSRSCRGWTASEGPQETAPLQVGFRRIQHSPSPPGTRRPAAAGREALSGRHQDHRQLPRRHDQQQTQPAPPPRHGRRRRRPQAGRADGAPGAGGGGGTRRHLRLPPAEDRPRHVDGAPRTATRSQLPGLFPSAGGGGELQPSLAFVESVHGGQKQAPVQQIPACHRVSNGRALALASYSATFLSRINVTIKQHMSVLPVVLFLLGSGEDDPGNTLFLKGLPSPLRPLPRPLPLPPPPRRPAPPHPPPPTMMKRRRRRWGQWSHARHPDAGCPNRTRCSGSSVTSATLGTT